MTIRTLLPRRHCLAMLLAAVGSLAAADGIREPAGKPSNDPQAALLGLIDDPRKAHAIGRAYLADLPDTKCSAEYLAGAICADAEAGRGSTAPRDIGYLVNQRVRREFLEGTMVAVDGWFLSLTEARLYALAALA